MQAITLHVTGVDEHSVSQCGHDVHWSTAGCGHNRDAMGSRLDEGQAKRLLMGASINDGGGKEAQPR